MDNEQPWSRSCTCDDCRLARAAFASFIFKRAEAERAQRSPTLQQLADRQPRHFEPSLSS